MKLTTKGRYAVTAMLDLSLRGRAEPVSLAEFFTRQEMSLPYLEQSFSRLRRNGMVISTRCPGGGYPVKRELHLISASDIRI